MIDRLLLALVVAVGVPGAAVGYIALAEGAPGPLPPRRARRARPWLWLGPALALLLIFLVYPSLNTLLRSFLNADSSAPVGLANYQFVFTDPTMLLALRNNVLWVVVFTSVTVALGLAIAMLVDRVPYEGVAKSAVF